jgi:hypothetical protein
LNGCEEPNSVRHAMSPGISASARSISRRPKSACVMSFTLYCACRNDEQASERCHCMWSLHGHTLTIGHFGCCMPGLTAAAAQQIIHAHHA